MKIQYILGLSALFLAVQSSLAVTGIEQGLIQPVGSGQGQGIPIGEIRAPNIQGQVPSATPTVTTLPKVQVIPVPAVKAPVMPEPKTFTTPKVPGAE